MDNRPSEEETEDANMYNINIFRIGSHNKTPKPHLSSGIPNKQDFTVQVAINNHISTVIADTGAKINVCGNIQAKQWNLLGKMTFQG